MSLTCQTSTSGPPQLDHVVVLHDHLFEPGFGVRDRRMRARDRWRGKRSGGGGLRHRWHEWFELMVGEFPQDGQL